MPSVLSVFCYDTNTAKVASAASATTATTPQPFALTVTAPFSFRLNVKWP